MKATLGDARPEISPILNLAAANSQVRDYINRAQRRLHRRGLWVGTYGRFRVCTADNCVTWPRSVETIESISMAGLPGVIRNSWYEFYEAGPGQLSLEESDKNNLYGRILVDRGTAPTFNDIVGTGKKVRVVADVAESASTKILLQGYDENNQWIRTLDGSTYIDGEKVAISTTPTNSTKEFTSLVAVQKPVTNGNVRLYEFKISDSSLRDLAIYEPDETRPIYRRSLLLGLCPGSGDCETTIVDVMAKLRFIPAGNDTDWLMIGNLDALRLAVQAILKEERNLFKEATQYWTSAEAELQAELDAFNGHGTTVPIRINGQGVWASEGIPNLM